MTRLNHHYQKLAPQSLPAEIQERVEAFRTQHPTATVVQLWNKEATTSVLNTTSATLEAHMAASQEMGSLLQMRGYGPIQGYLFLREAIAENEYHNLPISADEIFISNGIHSDLSSLQEIFDVDARIALPDPIDPIYLDTMILSGRTRLPLKGGGYGGLTYLPCTEEENFLPSPPNTHVDLIYLSSPMYPTGAALTRSLLKTWVDYAKKENAILIFDATDSDYITDPSLPRSIYEIEGALEVAIEVRGFQTGFPPLGCSFITIPHALKVDDIRSMIPLHALWKRRLEAKMSLVPYPTQKAAAALYSPEGKAQIQALISSHLSQGKSLLVQLHLLGYTACGGVHAPYLWIKAPQKMSSWEFFDYLLQTAQIVSLPGAKLGRRGEGYVSLNIPSPQDAVEKNLARLKKL